MWSKPLLCRFRQPEENPLSPVPQGFAGFCPSRAWIGSTHSQITCVTNCATPRNIYFYLRCNPLRLALLARLAVPEKILALFACSIFSTAECAAPRFFRHRRRSAMHPKASALPTAQPPRNIYFYLRCNPLRLALLARLAVPEKILALFACSIFSTAECAV